MKAPNLALYHFDSCPYCERVRGALRTARPRDRAARHPDRRPSGARSWSRATGKQMVPCLRIEQAGGAAALDARIARHHPLPRDGGRAPGLSRPARTRHVGRGSARSSSCASRVCPTSASTWPRPRSGSRPSSTKDSTSRGYLARLAEFAERARPSVAAADTLAQRVAALNRFLYDEQSFRGNRSDYYDARNSFLNEVIDRRTGIPITLAIVYLSVAARLGLPVHGVGFPGHFLVKCAAPDEIVIDPFEGKLLTRADCEARWRATLGEDTPFDARSLEPAPARQTLARVIGNLKQIFLAQQDWPRALACVERILVLAPDAPLELRDRGLLYARLECWSAAAADLQRFLELAPERPDAPRACASSWSS